MEFTKTIMFVCLVLASAPPTTLRDIGFGYPHHGTSPTPITTTGTSSQLLLSPPPMWEGSGHRAFFGEWGNSVESRKHISLLFLLLVPPTASCSSSTVRDIPCCLYSFDKQKIKNYMYSISIANIYVCLQSLVRPASLLTIITTSPSSHL